MGDHGMHDATITDVACCAAVKKADKTPFEVSSELHPDGFRGMHSHGLLHLEVLSSIASWGAILV